LLETKLTNHRLLLTKGEPTSKNPKVWLLAVIVVIAIWSGFTLIKFNNQKRLELQKLQQEKQMLLKASEENQKVKTNLEKALQEKEAEIKKLKEAKARPASIAYAGTMTETEALNWIISREGGATSVNTSSLACGLAQSLPCSKVLTFAGVDLTKFNLNTYEGVKAAISTVPAETQREWMRQYCVRRYGSVINAVAFWRANGWY